MGCRGIIWRLSLNKFSVSVVGVKEALADVVVNQWHSESVASFKAYLVCIPEAIRKVFSI